LTPDGIDQVTPPTRLGATTASLYRQGSGPARRPRDSHVGVRSIVRQRSHASGVHNAARRPWTLWTTPAGALNPFSWAA